MTIKKSTKYFSFELKKSKINFKNFKKISKKFKGKISKKSKKFQKKFHFFYLLQKVILMSSTQIF